MDFRWFKGQQQQQKKIVLSQPDSDSVDDVGGKKSF